MIVVDMESSGTEPNVHSLVSLGAVDFLNPENKFYEECRIWDGAKIEEEALAVNGFTREQIIDPKKQSDKELLEKFIAWASKCEEKTIAGQNPSLDRDFLKYTAYRYHVNWNFAHRIIDLHSICYYHMLKRGIKPPLTHGHTALNLEKVLEYVGMTEQPKPHNGLTDAIIEAESFHRLFYDKPLYPEFKKHPIPWLAA